MITRRGFLRLVGITPIAAAVAPVAVAEALPVHKEMGIAFPDKPLIPWMCSGWVGPEIHDELREMIDTLEAQKKIAAPWDIKLF